MLRNGSRILLLQHAISKPSKTCRLCCANNFDSKSYLHTSGDKNRDVTKGSKGSGKSPIKAKIMGRVKTGPMKNRPKFVKNLMPQLTQEDELFKPIIPEPLKDDGTGDIGEEIAGKLTKTDKFIVLKRWKQDPSIRILAAQHDMDAKLFDTAMDSFRKFCLNSDYLAPEIHVIFKNILMDVGHVTDLFPFFLNHAQTVYPHLNCMDDLRQISDLTDPSQWYPLARAMQRKVIFHAGPTNSGKTYHALKRYTESDSGVYCGPLRLLAMEVFDKCNAAEVPCDLITGETRMFANEDESASPHVACTVEMMNISQEFDVAVIDEIQMLSDLQRGWAWTRALLGVAAKEIHVCGEETAIDLVRNIVEATGDNFEVQRYERLTSLTYLDEAVGSFDNIQPGDCIVCFSKNDIFKVFHILVAKGHKVAVIYGSLPPGTKIAQSRKFNDPEDECNVMVATDAVGMGLNLAIKRVIFYSVTKQSLRADFTRAIDRLSTSQAQQIGGRAGRFRTQYESGEVTTFWSKDLPILQKIVDKEKDPLMKAGMNPTSEMIEMFSFHLPKASLSNLLDIFVHVCKLDDLYFMCYLADMQELAESIEHLPLTLQMRFTLCSCPLKVRKGFPRAMFVKIARQLCNGMPLTYEWLCMALGAPFKIPRNLTELRHLEASFDIVDLYLWLSYRYPDLFIDADEVRELRVKLDSMIQTFLLQGRIVKKTRLASLFDEDEQPRDEVDPVLIEKSPLQAYKPKPKAKDNEKIKAYAEHANTMFGVANTVVRTQPIEEVRAPPIEEEWNPPIEEEWTPPMDEVGTPPTEEVRSFWKDEAAVETTSVDNFSDNYTVKDSAQDVWPEESDQDIADNIDELDNSYNLKDSAVSMNDSSVSINSTVSINEDDNIVEPESRNDELDEERMKRFSKLTGNYNVKTMFQAEKVKKSMSAERKFELLNAEITKRQVFKMTETDVDNVATTKWGMNPEDVDQVKNLLTEMKTRKLKMQNKQKKQNKVKDEDTRPKFDMDKFVTVHKPQPVRQSVNTEPMNKPFVEHFKFAERFSERSSQNQMPEYMSHDECERSTISGSNNQNSENQDEYNQYNNNSIGDIERDDISDVHSVDAGEETDSQTVTENLLKRGILSEKQMQLIRAELENEIREKLKKNKGE